MHTMTFARECPLIVVYGKCMWNFECVCDSAGELFERGSAMEPWEQEWEDWAHYEELRDADEAVARSLDEWLVFEEELRQLGLFW